MGKESEGGDALNRHNVLYTMTMSGGRGKGPGGEKEGSTHHAESETKRENAMGAEYLAHQYVKQYQSQEAQ